MHTKNIGIVQKTVGILEFKKWVFRFWDFMGGIFFLSLCLFSAITTVNFRIFLSPQKEMLDPSAVTLHPFPISSVPDNR